MLAQQAARAARLAIADDVIDNSGDEATLDDAVEALHHRYLVLAAARKAGGQCPPYDNRST